MVNVMISRQLERSLSLAEKAIDMRARAARLRVQAYALQAKMGYLVGLAPPADPSELDPVSEAELDAASALFEADWLEDRADRLDEDELCDPEEF